MLRDRKKLCKESFPFHSCWILYVKWNELIIPKDMSENDHKKDDKIEPQTTR